MRRELSFTRLRVLDLPESAFGTDVLRDLGISSSGNDPSTFGLPFFVVTNFDTVTDSTRLPQTQRDNTWTLSDGSDFYARPAHMEGRDSMGSFSTELLAKRFRPGPLYFQWLLYLGSCESG